MSLTAEEIDDINLLIQYDLANTQAGLKIHQREASATTVATAARLHQRGLTTMDDGGYLTSLGLEAAEHAAALVTILRAKSVDGLTRRSACQSGGQPLPTTQSSTSSATSSPERSLSTGANTTPSDSPSLSWIQPCPG